LSSLSFYEQKNPRTSKGFREQNKTQKRGGNVRLLLVDMMRGPIYISFLIVRSDDRENNRDVIQQSKGEKRQRLGEALKKERPLLIGNPARC
jgi:hypothetical protein